MDKAQERQDIIDSPTLHSAAMCSETNSQSAVAHLLQRGGDGVSPTVGAVA